MLNDTLLTRGAPSGSVSGAPAGRLVNAGSSSEQTENGSAAFAEFFQIGIDGAPIRSAPQLERQDRQASTPATILSNADLDNGSRIEILEFFNSEEIELDLKTGEGSPKSFGLASQQHRSLNSGAQIGDYYNSRDAERPELILALPTAADAPPSPAQITVRLEIPQVGDLASLPNVGSGPASENAFFSKAQSFAKSSTSPPTDLQEILTPEPAKSASIVEISPESGVGTGALPSLNKHSASKAVQEFRHPTSADGQVEAEVSIASGPEFKPTFPVPATLSDAGNHVHPFNQHTVDRALGIALVTKLADKDFELRLDPPDLGSVLLRFYEDEAGVQKVMIVSSRSDTLDLLRRHSDVLQRELERAGVGTLVIGFQHSQNDDLFDRRAPEKGVLSINSAPRQTVEPHKAVMVFDGIGRIDRFA